MRETLLFGEFLKVIKAWVHLNKSRQVVLLIVVQLNEHFSTGHHPEGHPGYRQPCSGQGLEQVDRPGRQHFREVYSS